MTITNGKRLTAAVLRNHFHDALLLAAKASPEMAEAIMAFHFLTYVRRRLTTLVINEVSKRLVICLAMET